MFNFCGRFYYLKKIMVLVFLLLSALLLSGSTYAKPYSDLARYQRMPIRERIRRLMSAGEEMFIRRRYEDAVDLFKAVLAFDEKNIEAKLWIIKIQNAIKLEENHEAVGELFKEHGKLQPVETIHDSWKWTPMVDEPKRSTYDLPQAEFYDPSKEPPPVNLPFEEPLTVDKFLNPSSVAQLPDSEDIVEVKDPFDKEKHDDEDFDEDSLDSQAFLADTEELRPISESEQITKEITEKKDSDSLIKSYLKPLDSTDVLGIKEEDISHLIGDVASEKRPTRIVKKKSGLDEAIELIDDDEYELAEEILLQLNEEEPENPEILHYFGVSRMNQGLYAEAVDYFEKSLKYKTDNFYTHFFAGLSLQKQQQFTRAEKHFNNALKIEENLFARVALAAIAYRNDRFDEAEEMYRRALDEEPELIEAQLGLAKVLLARGYYQEANEIANELLQKDPDNIAVRHVLTLILMEREMYYDALFEAQEVYNSPIKESDYFAQYSMALLRNKEISAGLKIAVDALEKWPFSRQNRLVLVEGLILAKEFREAETQLEFLEQEEFCLQTYYLRALLEYEVEEEENAREFFGKFVDNLPHKPAAYFQKASFLEKLKDYDEALEVYKEITELFDAPEVIAKAEKAIERLAE